MQTRVGSPVGAGDKVPAGLPERGRASPLPCCARVGCLKVAVSGQGGAILCWRPPLDVVLLGMSFLFLFGGFVPTQTWLSVVYVDDGGAVLSVVYTTFAAACVPAPLIIARWGARVTLVVAFCTYSAFIAAAVSGSVPLLFVAAVGMGVGAGLAWAVPGVILAESSTPETRGRASGVFLALFRASVVGHFIAANMIDSGKTPLEMLQTMLLISFGGVAGSVLLAARRCVQARVRSTPSVSSTVARVPVDKRDASWAPLEDKATAESDAGALSVPREAAVLPTPAPNILWLTLSVFRERPMWVLGAYSASNGVAKGWMYAGFNRIVGPAILAHVFSVFGVLVIASALLTGWAWDRLRSTLADDATNAVAGHMYPSSKQVVLLLLPYVACFVGIALALSGAANGKEELMFVAAACFGVAGGAFEPILFACLDASFKPRGTSFVSAAFAARLLADSGAFVLVTSLGQGLSDTSIALVVTALHAVGAVWVGMWRCRERRLVARVPKDAASAVELIGSAETTDRV